MGKPQVDDGCMPCHSGLGSKQLPECDDMHVAPRPLPIQRFEIVANPERDKALVSFIGAARVEPDAPAWIEGDSFNVSRSPYGNLRFSGLHERDIRLLATVGTIYVNRSFGDGADELSVVRLMSGNQHEEGPDHGQEA